jgi:riboflavin kinase/FMN adenylyltransferase
MTALGLGDLPTIGPAVVTLGAFDGVHLGHRHLIAATAASARERNASSVALVFSPHPDEVVRPGRVVERLLPPEVTLERLAEAGADHAIEIRFDEPLRSMEPEAFLGALGPALELRAVTMTPDSAFGRGRSGTLERVAEIGATEGFDAVEVEPLLVDGAPVSSSRIRDLLTRGEIPGAADLLGAAPLLRGRVVHGDRRGHELGFPTANLSFAYTPALPALGIYLGRVAVPERGVGPGHPALVSVGVRPTFHDDGRILVEAYLLDWDGDLYETVLDLELDARLREERRFNAVDELVEQMRADETEARRRFAELGEEAARIVASRHD